VRRSLWRWWGQHRRVSKPLVYGLLEIGLTFVMSGDYATLAGVLLTMTDD
jgi:hypothetical protein